MLQLLQIQRYRNEMIHTQLYRTYQNNFQLHTGLTTFRYSETFTINVLILGDTLLYFM